MGHVTLARDPYLLDVSANVSRPYYRFVYLDRPWLTDPFAAGDDLGLAALGPQPGFLGAYPAQTLCQFCMCMVLVAYEALKNVMNRELEKSGWPKSRKGTNLKMTNRMRRRVTSSWPDPKTAEMCAPGGGSSFVQ